MKLQMFAIGILVNGVSLFFVSFVLMECVGRKTALGLTEDVSTHDDVSDVTWAHAVNSKIDLLRELQSDVDFLEADISMGHLTGFKGTGPQVPIMAHPPTATSDITFDLWLDKVISQKPSKNIKLDFKNLKAVEPSLKLLQKHSYKLNSSLWLNADILPGPGSPMAVTAVKAGEFLALCKQYFPNATLSVGWTTYWHFFMNGSMKYEWKHVRTMADVLMCSSDIAPRKITFPVRAVFTLHSVPQLRWLLETFPESTLTVWSHNVDNVKGEEIMKVRQAFPKSRVYYDLPEELNEEFLALKKEHKLETAVKVPTNDWMIVHHEGASPSCYCQTHAKNGTVFFGNGSSSVVLLKDAFQVHNGYNLEAHGYVQFYSDVESDTKELVLVLADVALFSKNFTDESKPIKPKFRDTNDVDIVWTAMKSSQLHVFRHDFSQESLSPCRFFSLNTKREKAFQAWTIPCDGVIEGLPKNDTLNAGIEEVKRNARLILPPGPVMFGFKSSGPGHVVVHGIEVHGSAVVSANDIIVSSSYFNKPCLLFVSLSSTIAWLIHAVSK